jgi:peroxiredoxin family protein
MAERQGNKKVTLICSRNTLDGVFPPLILALQGARKGADVNIFFTFSGIEVLKRGGAEKTKFFPPGMLGAIPGMPVLATKMMLKMAADRAQVPPPAELLEMCRYEGVKLWACLMTMQMMGLKQEDLIEGVRVIDAERYMDMALESDLNLFI